MRLTHAMIVFLTLGAGVSAAQDSTLVVGSVVSRLSGQSLPYSTFSLQPGSVKRFTNADGIFSLKLRSGSYKLTVKQLGFAQFDTAISLGGRGSVRLAISLTPVAYTLSAVRAAAKSVCAPDENMTAGGLLEEVKTNAEREQLLRTAYPFEYQLERTRQQIAGGTPSASVRDTVAFHSFVNDAYVPGKVVRDNQRGGHVEREMRIPQLVDFASDAFLSSHCFYYDGREVIGRRPAYVVRFEPNGEISAPDVSGSIFLDSASLQIRKAAFVLTRGEALQPAVSSLEVTTTYQEPFRGVSLFSSISTRQSFPRSLPTDVVIYATEVQKLTAVRFLGVRPDDARDVAIALPATTSLVSKNLAVPVAEMRQRDVPSVAVAVRANVRPAVADSVGPAAFDGVVTDSLEVAVAGVEISLSNGTVKTLSNSLGAFHLGGFRSGTVTFAVRKLGYAAGEFTLAFEPGTTRHMTIVIQRFNNVLTPVVVEESPVHRGLRDVGFYERAGNIRGTFLTPEWIASRGATRASDFVRSVNGVRMQYTGQSTGGLPYATGGLTTIGSQGLCLMNVFIDGSRTEIGSYGGLDRRMSPGGIMTTLDDVISASDVGAIEVYPSGVSTPEKYSGVSRGCGTILIWSKVKLNISQGRAPR